MIRMEAHLPARQSFPDLTKMMMEEARTLNKEAVELYEKKLKWKKPPEFITRVDIVTSYRVVSKIYTENEIFAYQDEGTKRHYVYPRQKKALHWVEGGKGMFSKGHWVSGIKAHKYTEAVFKIWSKRYEKRTEAVFQKYERMIGVR